MAKKRPARTERRTQERAARQRVRDLEKLAALLPGGSATRPIPVDSTSVIEIRVRSLACPLCDGAYQLLEHRAPASGVRAIDVKCSQCGAPRTLWFRLVSNEPN
ncbi:MAG: hypothetical protein H0X17_08735 [Deltaproteobacteria bacterium]|nr:hypothetical protein [Deltaproteobacteria bacterium]